MPALPAEIRKLAAQCLAIRDSEVPLHRVVDILATADGDISTVVNRFRDIKEPNLRRALHQLALLLRALEREAGLTPAWEAGASGGTAPSGPAAAAKPKAEKSAKPTRGEPKFSDEQLRDFEDESARGKVRVAQMNCDGACRGNPGPSGIGVVLATMEGQVIGQIARAIGETTNNIAEYTALIEGLKMAQRMGVETLFVKADSELMVKQMRGEYKIKNPDIFVKAKEARGLIGKFAKFTISYIGREHNAHADALSGAALGPKKSAHSGGSAPHGGRPPARDAYSPLTEPDYSTLYDDASPSGADYDETLDDKFDDGSTD